MTFFNKLSSVNNRKYMLNKKNKSFPRANMLENQGFEAEFSTFSTQFSTVLLKTVFIPSV